MHITIRAAAGVFAGLAFSAGIVRAQTPLKFAYVNTQPLMEVAPGRVEAESTFAKEKATYTAEMDKLSHEIDSLRADYSKTDAATTPAQKTAKAKVIDDKVRAATDRNTQLTAKLQTDENALMAPITEVVKKVLDDIRTEDGYTMIFVSDAVVAADKNLDITDRVVARLRTLSAQKKPNAGPVNAPAAAVKRPPPNSPIE